jgi:ribonuclease P protein subunit POP4
VASEVSKPSPSNKFVKNALATGPQGGRRANAIIAAKISGVNLPIDNMPEEFRQKGHYPTKLYLRQKAKKNNKQLRKSLSCRQRKAMNLFSLRAENLLYCAFEPLHQLWLGYMADLAGSDKGAEFLPKLIKAEYHGAKLTGTFMFHNLPLNFVFAVVLKSRYIQLLAQLVQVMLGYPALSFKKQK